MRPYLRFPRPVAAFGLASAALLAGCSDDTSVEDHQARLATQLRAALAAAGVTVPEAPPAVSDELFELGQALYFDKLLSGNQDVACSTCHLATLATADGRTLPLGVHGTGVGPARVGGDLVARNAPALLGAYRADSLTWDGAVERQPGGGLRTPAGAALAAPIETAFEPGLEPLAALALVHVTGREEMRGQVGENELADLDDADYAGIWQGLVDRIVALPAYVTLLENAYPGLQVVDVHAGHLGNALAAFVARAFSSSDSPFSSFLLGDDGALTVQQLSGGLQFFGGAGCAACHTGPTLSDGLYHDVGMPQFGPGLGDGLGADDDFGRQRVTGDPAERYRFRTPPLLDVELTAPYGHAGQFATLTSMVAHFRDVAASLTGYDVMEHVTEPGIVGTVVGNQIDVLANLSPLVSDPRSFDVAAVTAFLTALTAESARDLSRAVPLSVPSGLPID